MSVLIVFFVCMWCIRGCVFRREGVLVGIFAMGIFNVVILQIIMGSKFVTNIKKKTPLHFQASFLVN